MENCFIHLIKFWILQETNKTSFSSSDKQSEIRGSKRFHNNLPIVMIRLILFNRVFK
jgi:hypothetical protein